MKRIAIALLFVLALASVSEAAFSGGRCGKKPVRSFLGRLLGR